MEEVEEKQSKIPKIGEVINYKDFLGEYPIIFGIKIISSLALVYVILEFYNYHNPLDSLITKYARGAIPGFKPDPAIFVVWSFIAGFGFYAFTLLKGKYKFFLLLATVILLAQYISDPALDWQVGEHVIPSQVVDEETEETQWKWKPVKILYDDEQETEKRIDDARLRVSNLIFGSIAFLGAFGIWKRKGWAIAGSIALAIIIGFLHSPNLCLENHDADLCGYEIKEQERTWDEYLASGIFIGLGFIIYIELSYAAIKYENYADQFKPAGLDISLLLSLIHI